MNISAYRVQTGREINMWIVRDAVTENVLTKDVNRWANVGHTINGIFQIIQVGTLRIALLKEGCNLSKNCLSSFQKSLNLHITSSLTVERHSPLVTIKFVILGQKSSWERKFVN